MFRVYPYFRYGRISRPTQRLPRFAVDLESELQNRADNLEAREHLIHYYYEHHKVGCPVGRPFP